MTRAKGLIGALCLGFLLSGCASVMPDIDPPKVTVEKVESIPSESGAPRFQISLRVINTNTQSQDIAGISYGVEGYSEGVVTLDAGLQLFQVFRLLTSLGKSQGEALEYRFVAKIDFKGLVPTQHVEQKGELTL